jgi:Uma2 family endonuclease
MTTKKRVREVPAPYAVAELFPPPGQWSEEDYLALETNRIVELSEGTLEVLEMPNDFHQLVVVRLIAALYAFVTAHKLGRVRVAPLRVRLWPGKFREPDLVFMAERRRDRIHKKYWDVPDLVVEVISSDDPARDRVRKKSEYAQAGVSEYWIISRSRKGLGMANLVRTKETSRHAQDHVQA